MPGGPAVLLRRMVRDNDAIEVVLLEDIEYAQGIPLNRNPRAELQVTGGGDETIPAARYLAGGGAATVMP